MRFLLVAATDFELAPLVSRLTPAPHSSERLRAFTHGSHHVDILTTGICMMATGAWCARVLAQQRYELAVNLGVCGSFQSAYPPGAVVNVMTDCVPELGAEDGEQFLTAQDLGLLGPDVPPFRGGKLVNPEVPANPVIGGLRVVSGVTVNTVHGNVGSIARVVERFAPDVESMEGAAFPYACPVSGARFGQVRAISNMVEKRNRGAWKLDEAIGALNEVGLRLIEHA